MSFLNSNGKRYFVLRCPFQTSHRFSIAVCMKCKFLEMNDQTFRCRHQKTVGAKKDWQAAYYEAWGRARGLLSKGEMSKFLIDSMVINKWVVVSESEIFLDSENDYNSCYKTKSDALRAICRFCEDRRTRPEIHMDFPGKYVYHPIGASRKYCIIKLTKENIEQYRQLYFEQMK